MVEIHVVKAFTFQHDPEQTGTRRDEKTNEEVPVFAVAGKQQRFEVGRYEVDEWLANHWYVLPHLEGYVDPPPQPGQPDFMAKQLLAGQAARNAESMDEVAPKPAPLPPGVEVMRSGTPDIPADAHYFAGKRQPEATLRDQTVSTGVSYLGR